MRLASTRRIGATCSVLMAAISLLAAATAAAITPRASLTASASASTPRASLTASFSPDKAGQSTTIRFGFTISDPAPLKSMTLKLPAGMDLATTTLGLEECQSALLIEGPEACPRDSRLGYGTALTLAPLREAGDVFDLSEPVQLTALYGPPEGARWTVFFFVEGIFPVSVERVLTGHLQRATGRFSEALTIDVPEVFAWEEGPPVALTHFTSTIGPHGLTYTRQEHGKTISFDPRGLTVPDHCSPGGFPIAARFTWWNTPRVARVETHVPCPSGTAKRGGRPPAG